mgnify:CR=1 FL=1
MHSGAVADGVAGGKAGGARLSGAQVDALWDWDLQAPLTRVMDMESPAGGCYEC